MLSNLVAALRAWADGAGAIGVFVVSLVDSVALPLPNATDALILYLSAQQPRRWWAYVGAALAGAVLGSLPLYWLGRRGGEALLHRRFGGRAVRAMRWYQRSAFGTVMVTAFLPPPLPFKIFAVMAGATALPAWQFAVALLVGRSGRHVPEGVLAATYGVPAIATVQRYGATTAAIVAGVALSIAGLVVWRRRSAGRR